MLLGFFKCKDKTFEIVLISNARVLKLLTQTTENSLDIILQYMTPDYCLAESNLDCNKCDNHCKYLYYSEKNTRSDAIKKLSQIIKSFND